MIKLDNTTPASGVGRHTPVAEPRIIEVGEIAAGITVPEGRGVRFFSSTRDLDSLDGIVFASTEQAARAARDRIRQRTRASRHVANLPAEHLRAG